MKYLFDAVSDRLGVARKAQKAPSAGRAFHCRCGRPVFFLNSQCLGCGTPLGYEPESARMLALLAVDEGAVPSFRSALPPQAGQAAAYRRCTNFDSASGCNWLIPADHRADLCRACALNRMIPDLSLSENQLWWCRIELAKRRLVSSLIALGLPVRSRATDDPERGLAFDLLRPSADMPVVHTGHDNGIITLNIEEADDARREGVRAAMHEPYRTLLGHLRHEVGHYYWQRLIDGTEWHEPFRQLFGDERQDYAAALQRHYECGPAPGWELQHVSAYASAHPWEDWAETWAHYLHMVDTLDTALSFGLDGELVEMRIEPFTTAALYRAESDEDGAFLSFLHAWIELTAVLNELSRSMGQPDFYPFVLPPTAVRKLHFVHLVVEQAAAQREAAAAQVQAVSG
jgi:hypothetical protein